MKCRVKQMMIAMMVMALLLGAQTVYADSILPSLSDKTDETPGQTKVAMPSIGEALKKYPDSSTENEDAGITELYSGVTEEDYESFGIYMHKMGAELGDYRLEGGMLTAVISYSDATCSFIYDLSKQEAKITYPRGTYDKWTTDAKDHYSKALLLLEEGKTEDALTEILLIPQYRAYAPVTELLEDNSILLAELTKNEEELISFKTVGSTVTFGKFEQDNDQGNGPEPIEWTVLDYDAKENKTLLISRYGFDMMFYQELYDPDKEPNVIWETCSLRRWLNEEFLRDSFDSDEQIAILVTDVDNSASQGCPELNEEGSNNTQDRVFILSYGEASRYFGTKLGKVTEDSRITLTKYAAASSLGRSCLENNWGEKTADGEPAVLWCLRSPGEPRNRGSLLVIAPNGMPVEDTAEHPYAIRPALWLDLDAYLSASDVDKEQIIETKKHLAEAERLAGEGKTDEAAKELVRIPQYSEYAPVKELLQNTPDLEAAVRVREEKLAPFRMPGRTVAFGIYEQDRNRKNGREPIEWIVLDYNEKDEKALLISRFGLDAMPYNNGKKNAETCWETCSLRSELNGTFLNEAFTVEEQAAILMTEVDNRSSQGFGGWETDGGNNTQDKVFLLSIAEAKQYFGVDDSTENTAARISATAYANQRGGSKAAKGAKVITAEGEKAVWWWLRSPGATQSSAANVMYDGSLGSFEANLKQGVVRPVIWLDLNADIDIF